MKLFFTSDTKHYHKVNGKKIPNEIDNTNGIVDQLKELINESNSILYIAANPLDAESVDSYATLLFEGLRLSGISFSEYFVLDDRTKDKVKDYLKKANVIFLSGGNTFIENEFFKQINLKEALKEYDGIVIGQSAGSINMAKDVYNSPARGEESDPIYLDGLGLSNINIILHFVLDTTEFDEMQLYRRVHQINESTKRNIYALCDGTHILQTDDVIKVYGKAYLMKDGNITQVCDDKQEFIISRKN